MQNDGICGIYRIKNVMNGKSYIGSALNIADRWAQHRTDFAAGRNEPRLQASWDKFGPTAFSWILVEIVDRKKLLLREQYYLSQQSDFDLNAVRVAGTPIPPRTGVIHLRDVKEEDHPERLIEIIQNSTGKISKEEREAALIVLIRRFQYLIRKITHSLFYGYDLGKKHNWMLEDFRQEVFTEFIDLVINDFKIKENLDDTGLAVFGNYIKVKLYRRCQYGIQEKLRKVDWDKEVLTDFDAVLRGFDEGNWNRSPMGSTASNKIPMFHEIRESLVANALNYDEIVMQHMSDEQCGHILHEILYIAKNVLTERDHKVWSMYYLSGMMVGEIGQHISSETEVDKGIGRSRVLQIARDSNDRILREYGRKVGIQKAAL